MKTIKPIAIMLFVFVPLWTSPAIAGACVSKIRTVENMLVRLSEDGRVTPAGQYAVGLFRRIDIPSAKDHLREAKAYLDEKQELNCELHIVEAMRRLGVES